jgi:N-acetylmuramoyl-L-alanine amidase
MIVGIRAGHGMNNRVEGVYDPGAVARGLVEADIALLWAKSAAYFLRNAGIGVWLPRTDEHDDNALWRIPQRANAAGCDLLIDFHNNAASPLATGFETLYRDRRDLELAQLVLVCAARSFTPWGLRNRGVKTEQQSKRGTLGIFNCGCPTTVFEIAFISNAFNRDRAVLTSRDARVAFGTALAEALKDFRV